MGCILNTGLGRCASAFSEQLKTYVRNPLAAGFVLAQQLMGAGRPVGRRGRNRKSFAGG